MIKYAGAKIRAKRMTTIRNAMLGPCFVMQYFASFLVIQSSHRGRESWLLWLYCLLDVTSLLSVFAASSRRGQLFVVCECGISWSYSLAFQMLLPGVLTNYLVTARSFLSKIRLKGLESTTGVSPSFHPENPRSYQSIK